MKLIQGFSQSVWERIGALDWSRWLPGKFDKEDSRLVVQSVVIGIVVWGPVYVLKIVIDATYTGMLHWLEGMPSSLFVLLPLSIGAMLVYFLTRFRGSYILYHEDNGEVHRLSDVEGDGLERAIALYHTSEPSFERTLLGKEGLELRWELPTYMLALRKMGATWATLGSGGSGGLEGSVALIGESLAVMMFKPRAPFLEARRRVVWLRRPLRWWSMKDVDQLQTAQLGGIAAAVATLTGAPFMSAFFAAEVMYRRRPLIEKLIFSLISTLVAYFLSTIAQSGRVSFFDLETLYLPATDWRYYGLVIVTSVLIALVSIYFVRLRRVIDQAFHQYFSSGWARLLLGALLTGLIAVAAVTIVNSSGESVPLNPFTLVLGTGGETIEMALAGEITLVVALVALFGKILTTTVTIGSGGSAGLMIPSLYLGAMCATVVANLAHYEPMLLIAPAMTASLVSIANVPLAAILIPVELFSSHYLPAALLALIICTLLTQGNKIYRTQRETFDKRQILPGVEVRRITVPAEWDDKTLLELDLRRRFNVTIIGTLEATGGNDLPRVRLEPSTNLTLHVGDAVIAMGSPEALDGLEKILRFEPEQERSNRVA